MDLYLKIAPLLFLGQVICAENIIQGYGVIDMDPNHTAHISTHYSGIVLDSKFKEGDLVKKNQVLAVLEKNSGINKFQFRSPIKGTIIRHSATKGQLVQQGDVSFIISDLDKLWGVFHVHQKHFHKIKKGLMVQIADLSHRTTYQTKVIYISPEIQTETQTFKVVVEIPNPDKNWSPNQIIHGILEE